MSENTEPIRNIRCQLVSGEDVSYLEGRLKTLIDAIIPVGQTVQNKATKDMVRVILWDWFNFITDHKTDHLWEKKSWYKENEGLGLPDYGEHIGK